MNGEEDYCTESLVTMRLENGKVEFLDPIPYKDLEFHGIKGFFGSSRRENYFGLVKYRNGQMKCMGVRGRCILLVIRKVDKEHHFVSIFNTKTGKYCRTGIIKNGKDTGEDPFMASFPELIDVGVMGHCMHGKNELCVKAGVQCYQDGLHVQNPNMPLSEFQRLAAECKGKTFPFALGGRGDVDQHENFKEILECCKENHIVPNFTSSGIGFTEEIVKLCKQYCGAVAISWYRQQHTLDAIQTLLQTGVKTNVHYVLGNNSIDEALNRLKRKDFPEGINAVIFLLHKPVGYS